MVDRIHYKNQRGSSWTSKTTTAAMLMPSSMYLFDYGWGRTDLIFRASLFPNGDRTCGRRTNDHGRGSRRPGHCSLPLGYHIDLLCRLGNLHSTLLAPQLLDRRTTRTATREAAAVGLGRNKTTVVGTASVRACVRTCRTFTLMTDSRMGGPSSVPQ